MSTTLEVLAFRAADSANCCRVVATNDADIRLGQTLLADLVVDGGLGDILESDLVGMTVEVSGLRPYLFIGEGVRIVEPKGGE